MVRLFLVPEIFYSTLTDNHEKHGSVQTNLLGIF